MRTRISNKIDIKLDTTSLYLFAKLSMLYQCNLGWYSEKAIGTNPFKPIGEQTELTQAMVSKHIKCLTEVKLISIQTVPLKGKDFYKNEYSIKIPDENYILIENNFINDIELSVKEKGFTILLALLKEYPKNVLGISQATKVSKDTVRKYVKHLQSLNYLTEDFRLTEGVIYNAAMIYWKTKYTDYKDRLLQLESNRVHKMIHSLETGKYKDFPFKWKYGQLLKIEAGILQEDEHPELADIDL